MAMLDYTRIAALIFDFDGVLTDNKVYLDQHGNEQVACSRADGLAFDVFRKLNMRVLILSTEANPVVTARANKLKVSVIQNVSDKVAGLQQFVEQEGINLANTLYVGNDLNDYHVMKLCGYSCCPADSHSVIKEVATYKLKTSGGNGIAREIVEELLGLNIISILYS